MEYYNCFHRKSDLAVREGDKVEVVIRSSLYCGENEEPEYHSGILTEFYFEDLIDKNHPIGMFVNFNKDYLYADGEEELVLFGDIEYVMKKEYEIMGYAKRHECMVLSVIGENFNKIISFVYQDGSLNPEYIKEASGRRFPITEDDKKLISKLYKYGAIQRFSHFALS